MRALIKKVGGLFSVIAGLLMSVLMAVLVLDIVMRNLGYPLQGMAELSVFVMMIVIYFGFAHCEAEDQHVRLQFLTNRLPQNIKQMTSFLVWILGFITVGILTYAVVVDAAQAYQRNDAIEGVVNLPIWPTKFAMCIGMAIFFLQILTRDHRQD
ncbi:TRAP transporter small permease [Pelagibius sp. Alg239-R121]|uniref:TRAP transporter small permease n=1 Tax=Pelagibius sp. Alg239-R121 TaxID=2993448 RepID=UPI0024A645C1|nr:TRAP transporter small permease [Pelagibius sp. Alg239-R121]